MIPISDEVLRVLSSRLKLGERARPMVRVEVDRLAFVPGRTEQLTFLTLESREEVTVQKVWIDQAVDGTYLGSTSANVLPMAFPIKDKTLGDVTITSKYGNRSSGFHKGIDMVGRYGDDVVAVWAGKVVNITRKYTEGEGFSVNIKHSNGVLTKYMHLSQINVALGQTVFQGQIIGKVGNTGNVWTGGRPVTSAERAQGLGAHLHFEIWEGVNPSSTTGEGGYHVDPEIYLRGFRQMYSNTTASGQVTDEGTFTGYPGEIVFSESFDRRDWYKSDIYTAKADNFESLSQVEKGWTLYDSGGKHVWTFKGNSKDKISSHITMDLKKIGLKSEGVMNLSMGCNFNGNQGDEFLVVIDGRVSQRILNFTDVSSNDLSKRMDLRNIYIPKGAEKLTIVVVYGGWQVTTSPGFHAPKRFALDHMEIRELLPYQPTNSKDISNLATGRYEEVEVSQIIMGEKPETVYLQVGNFVYMDTLVLPNVISVEIDDQFEQEAREARITISNPRGYFSPTYNPAMFPEMREQASPWSYFINGFHVGVLSENTPIRIYLGYGQHLMRVFTGLIDKVDMTGEDSTMTITCRDMYKRLIEKVIMERKAYPDISHIDYMELDDSDSDDRLTLMIKYAKKYATQYGFDHKFLLAIAKHETGLGTMGMGTESNGSFVLGYGCYAKGFCDPAYKGISEQMRRGAIRFAESMASRGKQVTSKADVEYFHDGGDKGTSYTWSGDKTNWVNNVWKYYQEMVANPTEWERSGEPNPPKVANTEYLADKPAWVKSDVVKDLIAHAGLIGWRATSEDLSYPDYVIEDTVLIEANQATGKVIRAVPGKEGEFEAVDANSILTPNGWLNPFVEEYGKTFEQYSIKVSEAINEVIKDIPYRSYCDRYGTYRLEKIKYNKPVVAWFTEDDNLISISSTIDWSRGRSHIVVVDSEDQKGSFIDKEILLELKGEIRTMSILVPWAKTLEAKREVAERAFFDMKRMCRTLQVSIPANPALELLDRVMVRDKNTSTSSEYIIKGIRTSYSIDSGMVQVIDLTWAKQGVIV